MLYTHPEIKNYMFLNVASKHFRIYQKIEYMIRSRKYVISVPWYIEQLPSAGANKIWQLTLEFDQIEGSTLREQQAQKRLGHLEVACVYTHDSSKRTSTLLMV
jgi:hypothetical protein